MKKEKKKNKNDDNSCEKIIPLMKHVVNGKRTAKQTKAWRERGGESEGERDKNNTQNNRCN